MIRIDSYISEPRISSLFQPTVNLDENAKDSGAAFAELFSIVLKASTEESREASAVSREKTAELLTGQLDNLVDFKVAGEKSSILFDLNLAVRNKVLDAYNETMRLQV